MTQPTDLDQDTALRQRPRSVAEDLGENVILDPFLDQPGIPKSAHRMSQRRHASDAAQRHEQNLQQLQAAQRLQKDQAAHDEVMRKISRGEDIPPALAEQAMRYQRQQGELRMSSAQLIAARARRARG
jgi:hypothetical protein